MAHQEDLLTMVHSADARASPRFNDRPKWVVSSGCKRSQVGQIRTLKLAW